MSERAKPPRPYDTFLDWFLCNQTPRKGETLPQVVTFPPWALPPEAHRHANDAAVAELADLRRKVQEQAAEIERLTKILDEGCYELKRGGEA